jgi:hypothetical protein
MMRFFRCSVRMQNTLTGEIPTSATTAMNKIVCVHLSTNEHALRMSCQQQLMVQ